MTKTTIVERLRYRFDNFMSKGTVALISGLALVCLAFILLMAMLVSLTEIVPDRQRSQFSRGDLECYEAHHRYKRTEQRSKAGRFRLAMLIVTFGGIFGVSALIGLVSNGINTKLENLRSGTFAGH